jgi:hypothetical protein
VHRKSLAAQQVRALLTARKLVRSKLLDVENSLRGILRGPRCHGRKDHIESIAQAADQSFLMRLQRKIP